MIELDKSLKWMRESNALIEGISFETTKSKRVGVALFHLCLEHQSAIHLLVDNKVLGSALSMIRPQFEAFVRGVWFSHCATDEEIDAFINGGRPPGIRAQIKQIKSHDESKGASLSHIIDKLWGSFNDYTHGGIIQVKARNTEGEITKNYSPKHIDGLLHYSAAIAYSAGLEIAKAANNPELATKLMQLHQSIYE